jgi:hypothetical protein
MSPCGVARKSTGYQVKEWELIADKLSASGWSWGCVSAIDSNGQTIFVADAHRGDGKRFVGRADEKLTAPDAVKSGIATIIGNFSLPKGSPVYTL